MSRELMSVARRFADQQSGRIADVPSARMVLATVASVAAAVVKVTWRGQTLTAAGYLASYTPAPGDRVVCVLIDNQLIVLDTVVT